MINYQEITDNLDVENIKKLLDRMGIPFKETDDALIMPTVCHNIDIESASWKLYYYKNNHIFHCYTDCGDSFSIFTFLKRFYETRDIDYDWFQDIYQVVLDCSRYSLGEDFVTDKYSSVRDKYKFEDAPELTTYDPHILECFTKFYAPEWISEGITKEIMDKYNISFSISRNKIIIPHYDVNGCLVGIRGRALNEEEVSEFGKYMPVCVEGKWYAHPLGLNLYGLNVNKENIKREGYALLFEGEKSVLKLDDFSRPNCAVATCGSSLNKFQMKLLVKTCHPKEIIICYDNEEIGRSEKYFNKLKEFCNKYRNYGQMSFIYDMDSLTELKDSPCDKGEEVFEKLLEKRIKVR